MKTMKPTLVLDFDGVIHSYENGWQNGEIYGTTVEGFFDWAAEAKHHFKLAVFSSRSDSHKGIKPMRDWLAIQLQSWHWDREEQNQPRSTLDILDFDWPIRKPAAFVTIDDRAITFNGRWSAYELKPENLRAFKTWNQQGDKLPAVKEE